jgi:hypothetical protein
MSKRKKTLLVIALAGAAVLVTAGIIFAAAATARQASADRADAGEVLIGDKVVIRFRAEAEGKSPMERAQQAAEKLNQVLGKSDKADQFSVITVPQGKAIYGGDQVIALVTAEDAKASDTTVSALALSWKNNITAALGGTAASGDSEAASVDWEGVDTKWVPILDVANNGVRIGAAQVAGPKVQVEKVKAVAQLELQFRRTARIKVYVPIDSYNVLSLDRVQGVSVWAVGDVRIVKY